MSWQEACIALGTGIGLQFVLLIVLMRIDKHEVSPRERALYGSVVALCLASVVIGVAYGGIALMLKPTVHHYTVHIG